MSVQDRSAGAWLPRSARRFGDLDAIEAEGGRVPYAALAAQVAATTRWLEGVGVGAGDVVALRADNGPAWARWLFALAARGAALLPLNARLTAREAAFQLDDAQVRAWLVADEVEPDWTEAVCAAGSAPAPHRIDAWDRAVDAGAPLRPSAPPSLRDVDGPHEDERALAVLYTSGTTGRPKGVRLSARAFAASARASQRAVPLRAGDRWLVCMPLFHVGGLSILVRCTLAGATALVQPGFDERAVSRALEDEGVSHVSWVPTMLQRVLAHRGDAPAPASLRCVLLGGGAAPASLVERAWSLGYPVQPTYGLTEACSQVATRAPGDGLAPATGRLRPLDGVELVVRDADGRRHAAGAEGEICVRGPTLASGYVGHAGGHALLDPDGWLATGDVGRLDAQGLLEVLDRRDDLIVTGGENVYPAEVERVLAMHPAVAEAAVVGRPDAAFGARPVAFFVCVPGVEPPPGEALAAAMREHLAGYKVPVAFAALPALPRTASGKVQRARLRALAADRDDREGQADRDEG